MAARSRGDGAVNVGHVGGVAVAGAMAGVVVCGVSSLFVFVILLVCVVGERAGGIGYYRLLSASMGC